MSKVETLLLRGIPVRDAVFAELKAKLPRAPRRPGLAVVLVGDDPASAVYVKHKEKGCDEVGFHHVTHRLPATTPESEALARELKKRGWRFVGPTTVYAFMQAMGLVNDHLEGCCIRSEVPAAPRPGA